MLATQGTLPTDSMTATATPVVRLDAVRLAQGGRTVLDGVNLTAPAGSVTAILGPSGSGKSTLLSAITGQLRPEAGTVEVFGAPLPTGVSALRAVRQRIGVLLQGNGLLTDLTAAENVALPLRQHAHLPAPVLQRLIGMKLHAVGLRAAADLLPRELSGGMARRVALARALALDPPLMLYDEPLTGLDPIASGAILALIRGLNDSLGLTSLVVTHELHASLAIADRVLVLAKGGVVFAGTPGELTGSRDPLLRQFLDGAADGPIPFDVRRAGEAA